MSKCELHPEYLRQKARQEALLSRKNEKTDFYNGIYDRWKYPVLTRDHAPLIWRYDLDPKTNPHFMERLGINAVLNSGAIELDGKFYLVARVEGSDRKSFFAVAESDSPVDGFRFWDKPVELPDTCPEETNVYDMRLTRHEDGWIYGVFCSESKDPSNPDLSAAVAAAGIVRTHDLKTWERLPNLVTAHSPQQRNVDLLPCFVNGKYAFFTRPMDDFIDTGSGGGIGFGTCDDITHPVIDEEIITSPRRYHTITEVKNGEGATPIKTEKRLAAHRPRRAQHRRRPAVCDLRLCHRPGRALEGHRRAVRLPDRAPWRRAGGRRVQRGVHQRRHRAGQRRAVHLLCLQRHPAACGLHHGGKAAGLCFPHPGRPAAQPRLCGPAVRADRQKPCVPRRRGITRRCRRGLPGGSYKIFKTTQKPLVDQRGADVQ